MFETNRTSAVNENSSKQNEKVPRKYSYRQKFRFKE